MNITQIENNLQILFNSFDEHSFIYELLLAYGQPKASIKRLQEGGLNLSKNEGEILWKKKIFFKESSITDLHDLIDDLRVDDRITKHSPRFIIVTDYKNLLARDTKTNDTLDIDILEIPRHFDFFLPLAGMEKAQHQFENPADVKAAERMGKLYDEIKKDNSTDTEEEVHNLNVFLTRLLFCFFAEDTNIFEKSQFTHSLINHTQENGNDLNAHFERLFQVMNTPDNNRGNIPEFLNSFPYVNGGLFRNQYNIPELSRKSRALIIESGELNWSAINPDIFGSMIQAVISPEHRGGLGMHYTSVPNIMKVIEPLFLNDFYEEFESSKGNSKRLRLLLNRIWNAKFFDPACGSGNFLIITYKELRKLEMSIIKEYDKLKSVSSGFSEIQLSLLPKTQLRLGDEETSMLQFDSRIQLNQFYGIELDDFAHEVAILSLWLAEHQMNQVFFKEFGRSKPALPLTSAGNIIHGNATRLDWEVVCPKTEDDEIYIMGNPPYLGYALQSVEQKEDLEIVFKNVDDYKKLDFIACWFYLGSKYIVNSNSKFAFVTTNSICQGEQVSILWPPLINNKLEIGFAYKSFKWKNNAKSNAAVAVAIIGLRNISDKSKRLYSDDNYILVKNINPYLVPANNSFIVARSTSLSNLPLMVKGSSPGDNGNLLMSEIELNKLLQKHSNISHLVKIYLGADEFMNSGKRYCLWIQSKDVQLANSIPEIKIRLENCSKFRLASKKEATRKKAVIPYEFDEKKYEESDSIVIPQTGSERREYIPIGFLGPNTVVSNATRVIYNAKPYLFAIISSKIHITWVRAVAGRLKTDMQYSNTICYNTFPFPNITENQKNDLEKHVFSILNSRENHSEKTLAQLYDPDKMPDGLREAHHQLDLAVERCYRSKPFESDEERLEYLFKLYEQMIEEEKSRGTLFEMESKPKKKKK